MGKIISVINHKGGVGKTTTTANLSAGLAQFGKKILMVDFDPQANLTQSFGIMNPEITIYDTISGKTDLKAFEINENLYLSATKGNLANAFIELNNQKDKIFLLKKALNSIKNKFDFILIDCPPSLALLTLNALNSSDGVLIPIQPQYLAIKGLSRILSTIKKIRLSTNKDLSITGVILTFYNERIILQKEVEEIINSFFKEKVFDTKIKENISLAEAPRYGKDIFQYKKESKGAKNYMNLAKEFISKHDI